MFPEWVTPCPYVHVPGVTSAETEQTNQWTNRSNLPYNNMREYNLANAVNYSCIPTLNWETDWVHYHITITIYGCLVITKVFLCVRFEMIFSSNLKCRRLCSDRLTLHTAVVKVLHFQKNSPRHNEYSRLSVMATGRWGWRRFRNFTCHYFWGVVSLFEILPSIVSPTE